MKRGVITAAVLLLVLSSGAGLAVAQTANETTTATPADDSDKGQQSAEKNQIMQLVLKDPGDLSAEQRRRVVSWLLSPGNMDKLSQADRQAVRSWMTKAEEQGVSIPSKDALQRALKNAAESGGSSSSEPQKNYDQSCQTRISPALCITNVTWEGSTVTLTLKADYPHQITITDSGYIIAADRGTGSKVPTKTVTVSSGYTRVGMEVTNPRGSAPVITLGASGQLYVFKSPDGSLWAFINDPSTDLIQIAVISGAIGAILDLGLIFAWIRHREQSRWYDLARETYISPPFVRGDEDDDAIDKAKKTFAAHKVRLTLTVVGGAYAAAVLFGHAPAPNEIWNSLNNQTRLIAVGTAIAAAISAVPVYIIISYWRDGSYVYLIDEDAEDVVDAALGDEDGKVAMYRGTPELASDIEMVEGSSVTLRTTSGRCKLVREFDPERNEGKGVLSGLHNDREIIVRGKSAIHSNRNQLEDEVRGLRKLLYALPGISVASENAAARQIASEAEEQLTQHTSVTRDHLEDIFDDLDVDCEGDEIGDTDDATGDEETPDGE
ncbi:hypothetical protein M0R89_11545 [Halorussus limi]|uniref:Uncharacterized protein n=1 Tax=Halorussus limi TaxID=2938695 RepID=A0A8U0HQP6_9EURY|nr:hypothetical protein [Halorussus limi]UPV73181.1 hypothetical protein M0R89_11545 [Halorussus limi]